VEGRPPEDSDLVERAQRGDAAAYGELVDRYQGVAVRTAYVIAGEAAEAEDAAQEAFVKAYRALSRFRAGKPFRPWLLSIVANEARNRRRAAGRRAVLRLRVAAQVAPGEAAPSPEGVLIAAEERATLLMAVDRLGDGDRLVLSCRYFLELTEEETAAVLGVRRGTVKSRAHRALARLKEELT
jgi:RNA polymerase sigma-70 factor (ECF subfamily)